MGFRMPAAERSAKAKSDLIDLEIEEDRKRYKCECDILLLGLPQSGKSTIINQMKAIHQDGFSDSELAELRPVIYRVILDSAQVIVMHLRKAGLECVHRSNRALVNIILDYGISSGPTHATDAGRYFPPGIANAIHQLWTDPIIPKLLDEHSSELCLVDSAPYFLSEVLRIAEPGYLPNETDALRARSKHQGVMETQLVMGQLHLRVFNIGNQHLEHKRWIHYIEGAASIIFCASLADYDMGLLEGRSQNRMAQSLLLFESIVNSRWFLQTSIILLLTKIDLFKAKLPKVPLERYFPEYTGGADVDKGAKFILWRYMQVNVNRSRLSVYPHLTQVMDTTNVKLVFSAVKETILQNVLRSGRRPDAVSLIKSECLL